MRRIGVVLWAALAVVGCSSSATSFGGGDTDGGNGNPPPGNDAGTTADGATPPPPPGDGAVPPPADGATPPPKDGGTGGVVITPSPVTLIVEPSDDADGLLNAMKAATTSIHMTMYQLDDTRFIDALTSAHSSGLDVKVVLNQNFPSGTSSNNVSTYNTLKSAGVNVVWAPSGYTYTHQKTVILDGTTAWIMSMNLNTSSPSSNREYLAIDKVAADVAEAETIFEHDYANTTYVPSGNLLVAPGYARPQMVALIQQATKTVDLEGEELSDYMIVNALVAAQGAGITVRVVLSDATPSASQTTAVNQLKAAHVAVRQTSSPYIHAKALATDGTRAYVGSANFTTGSLQYNRELGVITADTTALGQIETSIGTDFNNGTAL